MKRKDSNVTLPMSNPNELRNLIAQNAVALEIPAKTVFLQPGDVLEGFITLPAAAPGTI